MFWGSIHVFFEWLAWGLGVLCVWFFLFFIFPFFVRVFRRGWGDLGVPVSRLEALAKDPGLAESGPVRENPRRRGAGCSEAGQDEDWDGLLPLAVFGHLQYDAS